MEEENDYKKTILIVDDEKMIINLLTHNLTREGYNVIEATDGLQAIEMAQSELTKARSEKEIELQRKEAQKEKHQWIM